MTKVRLERSAMSITRRNFIKAAGATAALAYLPKLANAGTDFDVVVVGGGFAGATVAKYLRMWSGYQLKVALVDSNPDHTSCVLSNLVLNGRMQLSELKLPLVKLANNHGVTVIVGTAESVTPGKVALSGGATLTCRRIVLATGISFEELPGWDQKLMPHAWIAGPQTTLLRDKLRTLRKGDRFVMTIPPAPYRCPPGPYERACVVADMLKRLGGGKVIVLDANADIVAEKHTFDTAFRTIYKDIVEYHPNAPIHSIDSAKLQVNGIQGKVVNIIAPHGAPALLQQAGLTNGGKWAPVNPLTYESTVAGREGIHVIGDSCTAPVQPKSAHMANSQAKVCADAIVRYFQNFDPLADTDRTSNITTNSACYSPITYSEASWLTANYAYGWSEKDARYQMNLKHLGEAEKWDGENFEDMFTWASNLFTDSFT